MTTDTKIKIGMTIAGLFFLFVIVWILFTVFVAIKNKVSESSYTKYNDNNFPGLISRSNAPRDTGNPIADIQLIRMADKNPNLARTIES